MPAAGLSQPGGQQQEPKPATSRPQPNRPPVAAQPKPAPAKTKPQPAPSQPQPKPAPAQRQNKAQQQPRPQRPPDQQARHWWQLASGDPFDLVTLRGVPNPVKVKPTLPRPFLAQRFRRGQRFKLTKTGQTVASMTVVVERIKRVKHFEQILTEAGNEALKQKDFDSAFELFARLLRYNPSWPGARRNLLRISLARAEAALSQQPPDYETAQNLCLEIAEEYPHDQQLYDLFRRAALARASAAVAAEDYTACWDALGPFLKHFPDDREAVAMANQLRDRANRLVQQAKLDMQGDLDRQRQAVARLATARRLWPKLPGIDQLIQRARRNYPVLHVAVFDQPGTFEPLGAQSLVEMQACQLIFDRLVELDPAGIQFQRGPLLLHWTQRQLGLVHDFELRHDQYWCDGTRLTAYDVRASLRLWTDRRAANYDPERARFIGPVRVLDPFRITVQLSRPHPRPHDLLAFYLLPEHAVSEPPARGTAFSRSPVGTGPFRVAPDSSPELTRFVANTRFRATAGGQPYIKEIHFDHYVNAGTAMADLERGKVQLMTRLDPLQVIRFSKLPGRFVVRNYLSNSVWMLALNHRRPPFQDRRLRRAILMAINRQGILTSFFQAGPGGLAHRVVSGPFPVHSPAYNRSVPVTEQNLPLAKQLVAELRRDGKLPARPLTLKYPMGSANVEQVASQLRKDLMHAGLQVRTEAKIEADLRHEVLDEHDFDIVYWRYDHRNVLYNIAALFDPKQMGPGGTNFMGYYDGQLDRRFAELRSEQRPLELWRIQQDIHSLLAEQLPFIPLWQLDNYIAYSSKLVYRASGDRPGTASTRQLPIHPLYLFRNTEGWYLEQ